MFAFLIPFVLYFAYIIFLTFFLAGEWFKNIFTLNPFLGIVFAIVLFGWPISIFLFLFRRGDGEKIYQQKKKELLEKGEKADAEVLNVEDTGATLDDLFFALRLTIKISPKSGTPFETTTVGMFPRIKVPKKGDILKVLFDPNDHTKILFEE